MKHLLLTTIAAVVLVGCGESQQSAPAPETKPVEPVAGAKAPDISIHDAAKDGNIKAVKQHLSAGADADVKGGWMGGTPLHYAAVEGRNEIAKLLIAKGADVNAKGHAGQTPLHVTASFGHKGIAELLVVNGADVNAKDEKFGGTPFHFVAFEGRKEIVELLIANGADVNAKDKEGETPLDVATHTDNPNASAETADLLRKHGGKTGEELKTEGK